MIWAKIKLVNGAASATLLVATDGVVLSVDDRTDANGWNGWNVVIKDYSSGESIEMYRVADGPSTSTTGAKIEWIKHL